MSLHRLYGAISKVTDQPDGTVLVEGIASTEAVDSQGEIVKASAMAAALPAYMKFGNVREMHQAIAAGKAVACTVDEHGITHITAHVVDESSAKKVRAGVLQGFSIGGLVKSRVKDNPKIIDGLDLTEISLVDRPANPEALFSLVKIDKPAEPAAEPAKPADPPAPVAKTPLSEELRKSLYAVEGLAEVLQSVSCIATDAKWEAMYEGDSSPIPGRLKAWLAEGCAIFSEMAAEEAAELAGGDMLVMAAKPGALQKTEKFGALLKAMASAAKGAPSAREQADAMFAKAMSLLKPPEVAAPDTLTKRAADAETARDAALAKVATIEKEKAEAVDAASQAGEALAKAMASLEAKGLLRLVPIDKAADGGSPTRTDEPEPTDPVSAIRKVHSGGGFHPFRLQ